MLFIEQTGMMKQMFIILLSVNKGAMQNERFEKLHCTNCVISRCITCLH